MTLHAQQPAFGAHLSIAGGYHRAIEQASAFTMDSLQIFTSSPSQWSTKPITDEDVAAFRKAWTDSGLGTIAVHDSYLINLAAPDETLFKKSIEKFTQEIERANRLGISLLVMHPGAHVGSGDTEGLARVVDGLDECIRRTSGSDVTVLIETTAGQGTTLGWKFEHISTILERVAEPDRYGVCLDTCHIFAAGYPLHSKAEYDDTIGHFDDLIGLERLHLIHLNDSVKGLGSRVDRHAGIGQGEIGETFFRRFVRDDRFQNIPMILETPKTVDGVEMDPVNLELLRSFTTKKRKDPR